MELFDDDYLNQVIKPKANYFDSCLSFAIDFVMAATNPFSSEDIIQDYISKGLPSVKESRVWGAVIIALKKRKLIEFHSYGVYHGRQGHGKPINIWRKK